jgi:hypothetical protein
MIQLRKSYEIVGYTYDADYHCTDCAPKRFSQHTLDHSDYTGECGKCQQDNDGNVPSVVFLDHCDTDCMPVCGDCFENLA